MKVSITRRCAAPWSDERACEPHDVEASMVGRVYPMPDGRELALVSYGQQPHWLDGYHVEVWGLVSRADCLDVWRDDGLRGARAWFGPLDAQSWRDRTVDGAWERARDAR